MEVASLLKLVATNVLFSQQFVELAGRHAEAVAGFQPGFEICQNGSFFSDVNRSVSLLRGSGVLLVDTHRCVLPQEEMTARVSSPISVNGIS